MIESHRGCKDYQLLHILFVMVPIKDEGGRERERERLYSARFVQKPKKNFFFNINKVVYSL